MFEGTFLVDTNSYIRIARSATCVLGNHGGLELRLLHEIASECDRASRLKSVTHWMNHPPHPDERKMWTLALQKSEQVKVGKAKSELRDAIHDVLDEFAKKRRARNDFRSVLSGPDKALFYSAYGLECGVVTDEGPLTALCKEFKVPHYTTLDLLKHMSELGSLSRPHIDAIVRFWQYEKDEPKNWKKEFLNLFGPPLPEL